VLQEIVEGDVVEIADFGAFLRIGPVDALLHVSQLMDDYMSYDEKQGVLLGKETKRKLMNGDHHCALGLRRFLSAGQGVLGRLA
jgi:DNA-directed RNA polymerase subunit E'